MTTFIDTSGLYALIDADDRFHVVTHDTWEKLASPRVTTQVVVAETSALVQRRLGQDAADALHDHVISALDVHGLTDEQFARASRQWRGQLRRTLSLVDVTSFVLMTDLGIVDAFAIDADFDRAGFRTLLG